MVGRAPGGAAGALAGLRVPELAGDAAAPTAGRLLASLGMDGIEIGRRGDVTSPAGHPCAGEASVMRWRLLDHAPRAARERHSTDLEVLR